MTRRASSRSAGRWRGRLRLRRAPTRAGRGGLCRPRRHGGTSRRPTGPTPGHQRRNGLADRDDPGQRIGGPVRDDTVQRWIPIPELQAGTYTLFEIQPAAYTDGADTAGTLGGAVSNDQIADIVLGDAGYGQGYAFGDPPSSISGYVYVDANNDGFKGGGEPGIAGVSVTLSGLTTQGERELDHPDQRQRRLHLPECAVRAVCPDREPARLPGWA